MFEWLKNKAVDFGNWASRNKTALISGSIGLATTLISYANGNSEDWRHPGAWFGAMLFGGSAVAICLKAPSLAKESYDSGDECDFDEEEKRFSTRLANKVDDLRYTSLFDSCINSCVPNSLSAFIISSHNTRSGKKYGPYDPDEEFALCQRQKY